MLYTPCHFIYIAGKNAYPPFTPRLAPFSWLHTQHARDCLYPFIYIPPSHTAQVLRCAHSLMLSLVCVCWSIVSIGPFTHIIRIAPQCFYCQTAEEKKNKTLLIVITSRPLALQSAQFECAQSVLNAELSSKTRGLDFHAFVKHKSYKLNTNHTQHQRAINTFIPFASASSRASHPPHHHTIIYSLALITSRNLWCLYCVGYVFLFASNLI